MDMADRLRQQRKLLKLTQTQLAEKVGMTQQMIQQLETRKVLTTGKLVALAGGLGVRPTWLATGEGPMQGDDLTSDEKEFLEAYRALEPQKRPVARMTLRAMTSLPTVKILIQAQSQDQDHAPDLKRRTG